MLTVDLARLGRDGTASVEADVPADAELWEDLGFRWAGPVSFALVASNSGSGEIVVRGKVSGALAHECRRCLKPLERNFEFVPTMVFVDGDSDSDRESGEYVFDSSSVLDLSEAVREEVVLAVDPYVVCDAKCRGLCSGCGVDLNFGECTCEGTEIDPRWAALRSLNEE